MPAALTNFYNLIKPEVGADQDIWGGELNQNFDTLDALLGNRVVVARQGLDSGLDTHQWLDSQINVPQQAGYAAGFGDMFAEELTTARWVEKRIVDILNQWIPINAIMLWAGNATDIPPGWRLCNGQAGTPNFSDRIVLSAGNFHTAGEYGGDPHAGLGQHTHQITAILDFTGGDDTVNSDYAGVALYAGGSGAFADLPYYTACYIIKAAYWPNT